MLELHRGCRKQPVESFPVWAMALLRKLIPNSAWFWGSGCEIKGEMIPHAFMFDNVPPESMQAWKQYEHLDFCAARLLTQRNVVHNFTHEMLKDTEIYRLLYQSVGIEQSMGIYAYKPFAGLYDGISLYRSNPETPFSEDERQAMQCVVPHLIEARHINYLEHLSSGTQRAQQQSLAAADGKGVIHVADDGFSELMRAEWPEWRGPRLPDPLADKGGASRRYIGRATAVRFVPVLDMFLLKARPRAMVDDLSGREVEIARHFAGGLTNKEIARKANLSPATVRNHLSSIYLKLGVGNKAELANMLSVWTAD
ncbi:MAG: LuxR C-terminal-related transcriptional regulator [Acidocella sp.]|nr:LuxR C-terminal-related transcriptional regulator [Acidocella sp.]